MFKKSLTKKKKNAISPFILYKNLTFIISRLGALSLIINITGKSQVKLYFYRSSNLGIYTSTTTYFEDCSSLVSEHLPTQVLIIVGNLLRWRVQYLYFMKKVGFLWSSWRRLDFVQTSRKGYPDTSLCLDSHSREVRRWHLSTFSRYSPVHS